MPDDDKDEVLKEGRIYRLPRRPRQEEGETEYSFSVMLGNVEIPCKARFDSSEHARKVMEATIEDFNKVLEEGCPV